MWRQAGSCSGGLASMARSRSREGQADAEARQAENSRMDGTLGCFWKSCGAVCAASRAALLAMPPELLRQEVGSEASRQAAWEGGFWRTCAGRRTRTRGVLNPAAAVKLRSEKRCHCICGYHAFIVLVCITKAW